LDNVLASFYKEFWGEEGEEEEEEEEEGPQTKKRKGARTDDRAGGVTGMFGCTTVAVCVAQASFREHWASLREPQCPSAVRFALVAGFLDGDGSFKRCMKSTCLKAMHYTISQGVMSGHSKHHDELILMIQDMTRSIGFGINLHLKSETRTDLPQFLRGDLVKHNMRGDICGVGIENMPCREKHLLTAKAHSKMQDLGISATGQCACRTPEPSDVVYVSFEVVSTTLTAFTSIEFEGTESHLLKNWLVIPKQ
jgi:hypothetical protein